MTHFGLGPRVICLWMLWLEGLSLNPWRPHYWPFIRTKEKVRIVISLMFLGAGPLLMRAHTKKAKKVLEEKGLTFYFYWNCLLTILPWQGQNFAKNEWMYLKWSKVLHFPDWLEKNDYVSFEWSSAVRKDYWSNIHLSLWHLDLLGIQVLDRRGLFQYKQRVR